MLKHIVIPEEIVTPLTRRAPRNPEYFLRVLLWVSYHSVTISRMDISERLYWERKEQFDAFGYTPKERWYLFDAYARSIITMDRNLLDRLWGYVSTNIPDDGICWRLTDVTLEEGLPILTFKRIEPCPNELGDWS